MRHTISKQKLGHQTIRSIWQLNLLTTRYIPYHLMQQVRKINDAIDSLHNKNIQICKAMMLLTHHATEDLEFMQQTLRVNTTKF